MVVFEEGEIVSGLNEQQTHSSVEERIAALVIGDPVITQRQNHEVRVVAIEAHKLLYNMVRDSITQTRHQQTAVCKLWDIKTSW